MKLEDLQALIDKAEMHKINNELIEAIELWQLVVNLHPNTVQGAYALEQLKKHSFFKKNKNNKKNYGGIGTILLIIFGIYIVSQVSGYQGKDAAENASYDSESSKELEAAQLYEIYYLSKTRGVYDFCKNQGVDITKYIKEYKEIESETYNFANKILVTNGYVFGAVYDKYADKFLSKLKKGMKEKREMLAQKLNGQSVTIAHFCKKLNITNKESLINHSFLNEKPELYTVLMNFDSEKKDNTASKDGAFQIINFNNEVQISVPRNWDYLDESMKKHLQTGTDAIIRTSELPYDSSENIILIAGNAHASNKSTIATLRVSIRRGTVPNQFDMRKLSKLSKDVISQELAPVLKITHQKVDSYFEGVSKTKESDISIVNNKDILCIRVDIKSTRSDGDWLTQVYSCPLGTKAVKLTTSYRRTNELLMKPVIQHVWQSLTIKLN